MSLKGVKYGLYIATPVYGEEVNVGYMDSIVQLSKEFQKGGIASVRQHIMHTSLIVKARNDSLSNFMNETELDYFIFIDADISFNPLDVIKLMNHDKPLVAATYPKKHLNWAEIHNCFVTDMPDTSKELIEKTSEYTIYHKKKKKLEDGLLEVDRVGTGFMMIKRSLVEKLEKKYPELMYKENGKKGYGFFETMIKRKEHLSEDYAFCERVKSVKEKVYIDPSIEINHHGGNIKFYGNYQNHLTYGNKK
jgi:glycosyltransferase involved in cell wall biosynthesis